MRYESLLASRYIKAQKRQSVFTVVSIATAVAVMAMVFLLYSVFMDCCKSTAYSSAPYHLLCVGLTEEQGEALQNEVHVRSVKLERAQDGTVMAAVLFESDIGDREQWMQEAAGHIGSQKQFEKNKYQWNDTLMMLDSIGDGAQLFRLRIFSLFFLFAVLMAFALRLIIDTAFEVSSKERERHYGVLQSIGATPEQIVRIITREGLMLCLYAVPLGLTAGIVLAYAMYHMILSAGFDEIFQGMTNAKLYLPFSIDPKMLLTAAAAGIVWVFLSAYGVGMRIIRKMPMEAITARTDNVEKVRRHTISGLLFGISGSIASRNARRQKKRFVITVLTLTVSITLFALFSTISETVESSFRAYSEISVDQTSRGADFMAEIGGIDSDADYQKAAAEIADSGLFRDIRIEIVAEGSVDGKGNVAYVNREAYTALFGEDPPVSYDELIRTGGYVLNQGSKYASAAAELMQQDTLPVTTLHRTLPEGLDISGLDRTAIIKQCDSEKQLHEASVIGSVTAAWSEEWIVLFGALETYQEVGEEWYGDLLWGASAAFSYIEENDYNSADYKTIIDWFNAHVDTVSIVDDSYGSKWLLNNVMSAVRAGVLALNMLIALAALINLMNILSTGIANRRSEMASLQCVGMTDRQLYRMTLIECLQFAGTAAVISAVICAAVIFGSQFCFNILIEQSFVSETEAARNMIRDMIHIDPITPFVRIGLAALVAFAAGAATSFVMLRMQNSESLSDQIRGTELNLDSKRSHILRNSLIALAGAFVLVIAGLRIYTVVSFQHDRNEFAKAGYLNLVDANGIKMNVYSTGAGHGKHTIVGLAGMGANAFPVLTTELNELLGQENTLVYPDRAGYGFTDDSLRPQTLAQVVEDYRAGLKSAGFEGPYVLMGHSYGSYYALWWEMQYPDEVESIVFLDGTELMKNEFWFEDVVEVMYPSRAEARAAARRNVLRTWLGLDRLFPAETGDPKTGKHIYGASVLSEEQIRLWELSDRRTNSAAGWSELLLMGQSFRELSGMVTPTGIPKLYLSTTPACEEDIREAEEFIKADREAAGLEYGSDPAMVAKIEWKSYAWQTQYYLDDTIAPFMEQIGSGRYVTIGGDHGIFYAQKPQQTADEILKFLAETTE